MGKTSISSEPPKRLRVVQEIMRGIENGTLKNGERLAPVRKMSEHFNVSLSVVQNAMHELMENGLVECRGASGFYVCTESASGEKGEALRPVREKRIYLSAIHHSDLVWRRTYQGYDSVRDEQLGILLSYARKYPQFHFAVEQAEILCVYLEAHPETREEIRRLHAEGRFECFGGVSIPDCNLISGESLLQNQLLGQEFYESVFGERPEVACMTDAFGMCAQLPQILLKCGYRYLLPGRRPNLPHEFTKDQSPFRWRALDGSEIVMAHGLADITHLGYECNVPVIYSHESQLARSASMLQRLQGNVLAHYTTEEGTLLEELFWILETANRNGGRPIEFGSNIDFFRAIKDERLPVYQGEINPVFTGCYTTRISIKQQLRLAENLLVAAEMTDIFAGKRQERKQQWHEMALVQFHDAAAGCHTDEANKVIREKIERVLASSRKAFDVPSGKSFGLATFGTGAGPQLVYCKKAPEGVPVQKYGEFYICELELPACGVRHFREAMRPSCKVKRGSVRFKTDFFEVDFSKPFPAIRTVKGDNVFADNYFGEILFREDFGTMWSEQYTGSYYGREWQKEEVAEIQEGPVFIKVITSGEILPRTARHGNLGNHWPGFESLSFRKEYLFPKHLDTFRLKVTLEWKGKNTQVSIRFPLELDAQEATATYEVPFGSLVRKPYFEVKSSFEPTLRMLANTADYATAHGNWPALNWVNYSDLHKGVSLANNGTPGHQLVNNEILVTLLRSGSNIKDGCMVPQQGSFENGSHEYEFAFCAHSPREMERGAELGRQLNCPPQLISSKIPEAEWLRWEAGNVMLSAMRWTPEGILVRLYETLGRQCATELRGSLLDGRQIFETDLAGRNPVPVENSLVSFKPFEIKTFVFK